MSDAEKGFQFTDPREQKVHQRLLLLGPGPAAFYRDASRLMRDTGSLETLSHLIGHLLREIESAVRAVLLPHDFVLPEKCENCGNRPEVHKKQIAAIVNAYCLEPNIASAWFELTSSSEKGGLARLAHRNALLTTHGPTETLRETWDSMVSVLEAVTAKFEVNFLNSFSVLDELLTKTNPGSADARILKNNVPNNLVTLRRFFSALENPRWLDPLKQQGFFSHVPETVPDEDGNARFQPWAESPYLVRIAGLADYQEKVLAIAREIPDTENIYVHEDLADIALVLPPHLSAGLVSKLQHCLENSRNVLLPNKAGALVSHLAKGQQTKAALDLARTLLAVIPRPSLQKAAADAEEPEALLDLRPEPDARFDTWIYERIIEKNIPDLVSIAGLDAFLLLCDLLETALVSSRSENSQGPEDYSYIWRPDISDREEKHYHRVRDVLVSAVRDAGKEN